MALICKFCSRVYTKQNVTRHRNTKICKSYQNAVVAFNKMLLEDNVKITCLDDLVKKPFTGNDGKVIYLNPMQLRFLNKLK